MVLSVLTNISSLNAQHNLSASRSKLDTAIQRLSSGLRINSAKDDAAGLAISTRFTTQINGLNQAVRNANDGISLSQTTESALNEVTNNLQRIRELGVQSANATNSQSDRDALDAEVQQRLAEITRISTQTSFNGRHVLDGSFGNAAFQIGANVGESISVDLSQGSRSSDIGGIAAATKNVDSAFATTATAAVPTTATSSAVVASTTISSTNPLTIDLGNGAGPQSVTAGTYANAAALATAINTAAGSTVAADDGTGKLKITNATSNAFTLGGSEATTLGITTVAAQTPAVASTPVTRTLVAGDLSINGTAITGAFTSAQSLADGINSKGITGVSAYLDASGALKVDSQSALTIAGSGSNFTALGLTAGTTQASGSLVGSNVKSVSGANDLINRVDSSLSTISSIRSELGAVQNRFESTISNLQTISQNLDASRSSIQDADFAQETANLSSSNILQQAGVSVLAQANSSTQSVLKLLQ